MARAVIEGRIHVSCNDIRRAAVPVLRHRVLTNFTADSEGLTSMDIVRKLLDEIGYHVRDYFLMQWDRFSDISRLVLGISTLLRGSGTFQDRIERPRIQVTLATGIAEPVCRQLNLGYQDPASINPATWQRQQDPGSLFVPEAGETLYRLENASKPSGGSSR